ncbi:MAG: helix-turn-helix transcriptional regulator [Chloroflexi bacterium]|nr:helix-turn-helix transcriptional regulator [Chloroflexota bacterium]MBM3155503.1 helix-turn-helix transcriptional regulator [Chloroflexota bacterium]MBM3182963.1 helix-turn-helix transcriptional regulator [Chloroflexota bacterium]
MARTFKGDLTRELQDKQFANGFGSELAKTDFAMLLVKARKAAGITQQELAARAGTTQAYIAKLESGEANPTIGKVGELLALLGFRLTPTLSSLNPYLEVVLPGREPQDAPVAAGKTL